MYAGQDHSPLQNSRILSDLRASLEKPFPTDPQLFLIGPLLGTKPLTPGLLGFNFVLTFFYKKGFPIVAQAGSKSWFS